MSSEPTLRCPSCRRANLIPRERRDEFCCSRCDCELEPLLQILEAAAVLSSQAEKALRLGEIAEASRLASKSWELAHSSNAAGSGFLACVIAQDWRGARRWQRRTQ